jgi:hypothetical protein
VKLSLEEVREFYRETKLNLPAWMKPARRHYRVELWDGKFLKLNRFENRINPRELREYLVRYAPKHVYMSVLSWLFPERVGPKRKANSAIPLDGVFLVDLDVKTERFHHHTLNRHGVCEGCLLLAKCNAVRTCEVIEENYTDHLVVFSGRKGFHVLFPFAAGDWTHYRPANDLLTQAAARFKYALHLKRRGVFFDFKTSIDPLRVHSVPESLNAETGLVVKPVGQRHDLESRTIARILDEANLTRYINPVEFGPLTVTLRSDGILTDERVA